MLKFYDEIQGLYYPQSYQPFRQWSREEVLLAKKRVTRDLEYHSKTIDERVLLHWQWLNDNSVEEILEQIYKDRIKIAEAGGEGFLASIKMFQEKVVRLDGMIKQLKKDPSKIPEGLVQELRI